MNCYLPNCVVKENTEFRSTNQFRLRVPHFDKFLFYFHFHLFIRKLYTQLCFQAECILKGIIGVCV